MTYPKRGVLAQMWGVPGLVFGIFFAVGLIVVVVAGFILQSGRDFAANGVDVAGRVEKLWESTETCRDNNNHDYICQAFNVGFGFAAAGKTAHGSQAVGYDIYAGLTEGSPVKVRYRDGDPTSYAVSFDGTPPAAMGDMGFVAALVGGIGSLFLVLGGVGLLVLYRIARRQVGLRDWGVMRGAVVLAQVPSNVTVNDQPLWCIRWKDDSGVIGQSRGRSQDDLPDAGERITIYADPDGKLPPVWEGDSGTR